MGIFVASIHLALEVKMAAPQVVSLLWDAHMETMRSPVKMGQMKIQEEQIQMLKVKAD
jgi:hypothetical protein